MQPALQNTKSPSKQTLHLDTPLRYLKGVGPRLAEVLAKKNLFILQDLIYWYPRIYRDQKMVYNFKSLMEGAYITLYGTVFKKKNSPGGKI